MTAEAVPLRCPCCGEPVELVIDESGGSPQSYIEDCPVCCRAWQVRVICDPDTGWVASLRTLDE